MSKASLIAWVTVGVLIVGSLLASGRSGDPGDPGVVKIVSSLPRTGSAKAQTDTIVNGIEIALVEADYKCGPFKVVYGDWDDSTAAAGQWTAEAETANARRAVRDPDVMVYIGTYNSGAAKMSMPILNRAHLLMVSPANTSPGLTKPGKGDPGEPEMYRPTGNINWIRPRGPGRRLARLSRARRWAKELRGSARIRTRRQPGLRQRDRRLFRCRLSEPGHRGAGARKHRRQGPGVQSPDDHHQRLTAGSDLFWRHDPDQGRANRQGYGGRRPDV